MLSLGKDFVIILFIASAFAYGFKSWTTGLYILIWFAIIKIVWNILR